MNIRLYNEEFKNKFEEIQLRFSTLFKTITYLSFKIIFERAVDEERRTVFSYSETNIVKTLGYKKKNRISYKIHLKRNLITI